jgi:hypothetical protein
MKYTTQQEKAKEFLIWSLNQIADGESRKLDQFLAKAQVEYGYKKKLIMELLEDFHLLGKIHLNKEKNSLWVDKAKATAEAEKEVNDLLQKFK